MLLIIFPPYVGAVNLTHSPSQVSHAWSFMGRGEGQGPLIKGGAFLSYTEFDPWDTQTEL